MEVISPKLLVCQWHIYSRFIRILFTPHDTVSVLQTMHVSGWTRLLHDKYYDSKQEVEYLLIILI
jgi:hypothetical protein